MADPAVLHANVKDFVIAAFRQMLDERPEDVCAGVIVAGSEPASGSFPKRLLVVGDDGQNETGITTAEATIRLSVLAGTKVLSKDADDLARIVFALARRLPTLVVAGHLNSVAAVLEVNGPFEATEAQDRARRFGNVVVAISGAAL